MTYRTHECRVNNAYGGRKTMMEREPEKRSMGLTKIWIWMQVILVMANIINPTDALELDMTFLNLTARIYSPCPSHITKCPRTDFQRDGRLVCMFGQTNCPEEGTHYFCGRDPKTNILAEYCFPTHICAEGSKNAVRLDLESGNPTIRLDCVQCDESSIQHGPHDSSKRFTSECDTVKTNNDFENKKDNMISVKERWPTDFDLYACDYTRGYSDTFQKSLCTANNFCACVTDVKCTDPNKPQVLPNGQCDAECDGRRDPFNDFKCSREASVTTAAELTSQQTTTMGPTTTGIQDTTEKNEEDDEDSQWFYYVVGAVVFVVVTVVMITLVVRYCGPKARLILRKICNQDEAQCPERQPIEESVETINEKTNGSVDRSVQTLTESKTEADSVTKKTVVMTGKNNTYKKIKIINFYEQKQPKAERSVSEEPVEVDATGSGVFEPLMGPCSSRNTVGNKLGEPRMEYYPSGNPIESEDDEERVDFRTFDDKAIN